MLLGLLGASPWSRAALDDVQAGLLEHYPLPLRWDNVERPPSWTGGQEPGFRPGLGMHLVRLGAGDETAVRLPEGQWLRLYRPDGPLAPEEIRVAFSSGTGLYIETRPVAGDDRRSLFFRNPAHAPGLVRIRSPAGSAGILEIGLFVSRHEPQGEIAPYRELIALAGRAVWLRRGDDPSTQRYWVLAPGAPLEVDLSGPARYALDHRVLYAPDDVELRIDYSVIFHLGGEDRRTELQTSAETFAPVWMDSAATMTGRLERAYLEVPAGTHRVRIETTANLCARLLRQADPDFLIPEINAPHVSAREVRARIGSAGVSFATLTDPGASVATKEQAAANIARDNRRRDGGLLAAAAMQEAAAGRPDYPEVQRVAEEMLGHYTFYRDLLPKEMHSVRGEMHSVQGEMHSVRGEEHSVRGQYLGWFIPRTLQDPRDFGRGITVAEQHREELLSRIGEALFVPLAGRAGVHRYPLPERFAPGWLRVVVDRRGMSRASKGPRRFLLRLEGQDPIAFEVDPGERLSEEQYAPSLAHAGLSLLAATDPGGPLSAWWPRGRPVDGAVMEIPLPPEPREIQVWSEDPGAGGLGVALQYRASRRFQLSEALYLEWARATHGSLRAFLRLLRPSASTVSALDQHWLPLVRFLQSRGRLFAEGVAPGPSAARTEPLGDAEKARLLGRLTRERDSRQPLAALESLSRLAAASRGRERLGYELRRVETMRALGETFLAEHMLRGLVLHGPDPETRAAAERRLRDHYREAKDSDALIALLAARVVEAGELEHVRALAEVLIKTGELDAGLALGLLLPEERRPREAMLRAALGLRAWRVYGESLARVKDPRERALWAGLRALAQGDHDTAEARFAAAGAAGLAWSEAVRSARSIHARLGAKAAITRETLRDWEAWLRRHPGPRLWQEAPELITDYAGAETLYAPDQDLYSQSFRSQPGRPLMLRLVGPMRIRLEVRPLHPAGSAAPWDGWVRVREPGLLRLLPISANLPAPGLRLAGPGATLPGRKALGEFAFGPGPHAVAIESDGRPVVLRVFAERPGISLGVLPLLSPETLALAASEPPLSRPVPKAGCGPSVTLLPRDPGRPLSCIPLAPVGAIAELPGFDDLARRYAAIAGSPAAEPHFDPDWPEAPLLARGAIREALALAGRRGRPVRQMELLLWLAEQRPRERRRALALAESLVAAHPREPGLQALHARLTHDAVWAPVTSVQDSAGVRLLPVSSWQPEAPALRVRKPLLGPTGPGEEVVSGETRVVLAMTNLVATTVGLELTTARLPYVQAEPLVAFYQIDEADEVRVRLDPESAARRIEINVAAGGHRLRVGIAEPVVNQFLRVRFTEAGAPSPIETRERVYHVATREEPVALHVPGPSWLRVDELRDAKVWTHYHLVEDTRARFTLYPEPGRAEALFRVYRRDFDPEARPPRPRASPRPPPAVPAPNVRLAAPQAPSRIRISDNLPLGTQEDGTWSLALAWQRRRDVQEDRGSADAEEFGELSATYRYLDADQRRYYRLGMLGRIRERGGPTLGWRARLDLDPVWSPVSFALDGSLFLQDPGDPPGSEWAGQLGLAAYQVRAVAPKTRHVPSARLFVRALSIDSASEHGIGRVDQDVFTPYKDEHQRGVEVEDTLYHRPWLDVLWYTGFSFLSNEDLNPFEPDRFTWRAGWRQLFRDIDLDAGYRLNHYFADDDRAEATDRPSLSLELSWDRFVLSGQRLGLGVEFRHDLDNGANNAFVYFAWHESNGRGYRDFRTGEVGFKDLRERDIPALWNNRIETRR